nr:DUF559 domain-containing protein [uncultured Draconibacterium sp.]
MDKTSINELRERLLNKQDFIPVFDFFIKKSVAEYKKDEPKSGEVNFSEFYHTYLDGIFRLSIDRVFKYSRSPIETITLNSLILLFIKGGELDLQITEPFTNFEEHSSNLRKAHQNIMSLSKQYIDMTGDKSFKNFESFFEKMINEGLYTKEDYQTFEYHRLIVDNFLSNSYNLTIQARLPDIIVNKKGITVDLLFWKLSDEKFKLVVECDGFKWHKSKEYFTNDRKRDRLLKSNGYDVIRFSGSEIYNDPVNVAVEIYEYISEHYNS